MQLQEQLADKEFNENWVIRVYNATDLNQIIAQLIEGDSFELNTSSWKPGVYIICNSTVCLCHLQLNIKIRHSSHTADNNI